jgi:hypothetical protein
MTTQRTILLNQQFGKQLAKIVARGSALPPKSLLDIEDLKRRMRTGAVGPMRYDGGASRNAAASSKPNRVELAFLRALIKAGKPSTATELSLLTAIQRDTLSPRVPQMVAKGLIARAGTRVMPNGRASNAYIPTALGSRWLFEARRTM